MRAYRLCELMVNYLGVRYIRDYPRSRGCGTRTVWNALDIFTRLEPRLSHVPRWRPRQRNQGRHAEHIFSESQKLHF